MGTIFDSKELVDFAYLLVKEHENISEFKCIPKETIFRTIMNRAYYGAFLKARDTAGIKNISGSVHKDVIKFYENKQKTKVSNNLQKLLRNREKADYHTNQKVSVQEAKSSLTSAKKVIDALDE